MASINHDFGTYGSYYISQETNIAYNNFSEGCISIQRPELDATGVLSLVSKGHLLADRTVVKQFKKLTPPFFTGHNASMSIPAGLGTQTDSLPNIVEHFIKATEIELLKACHHKQLLIVPLSGGMDSRIVLATLVRLRQQGKLLSNIKTITWGTIDSRDVVYAARLSEMLQLPWEHVLITPDVLLRNVSIAAKRGLEYSPMHLHGKSYLRGFDDSSLVVAASFGDSIGRARYSGRHILKLLKFTKLSDKYNLIKDCYKKAALSEVVFDFHDLHSRSSGLPRITRNELDYQAHYMHRFINSVWSYVAEENSVYQAFTTSDTWKYMIGLRPQLRTDLIYCEVLKAINHKLLDVPWASTGQAYFGQTKSTYKTDNLTSYVAPYGKWVREDLHDHLYNNVFDGSIASLNIFNMQSIKRLFFFSRLERNLEANYQTELILWLAALSEFLKEHNINSDNCSSLTYFEDFKSSFSSYSYEAFRRLALFAKSACRSMKP
jgi:hypothetical protein